MNMISNVRSLTCATALLSLATVCATASFTARAASVVESRLEFIASGDFNGDGQEDIAVVDRSTGRVRLGYRVSKEFFNWADWRPSGAKGVTGVSVGKLVDAKRDSLALVSADANTITVLDAPNPSVMTEPVEIPCEVFGPNVVVAADIGGAGNTPLHDLYVVSIYNADPENQISLFRASAGEFSALGNQPAAGAATSGQRVSLKTSGPELVATTLGDTWRAETLASGKPEAALSVAGIPAGATALAGNFRSGPLKDVVFFKADEANIAVSTVTEAGGKLSGAAPKPLALPQAARGLTLAETGGKSRLLAIFGTNEPAQMLNFDGATAPTLFQALPGATNKVLNSGVALSDAVVLFSSLMDGRASTHYQVYVWQDDKFAAGAYGSLATLDDRDDSTVPEIHKRIVANQKVTTEAGMNAYTNTIPGTQVTYAMTPIPGGEFLLGSPEAEENRKPDEGPQVKVKIDPFWMGTYEVTWDQFLLFIYPDDEKKMREANPTPADVNELSDAVTRPSKPYVDMSFGMGKNGYPAIAMTQHGANKFCHWLSAKTGHFYRLPTEAEWEYACRAGTTTAYSFGADANALEDYAWFFDNSNSKYQKVGKKKPNAWGLYDMHGNVTEWVLDQYAPDYYATLKAAGDAANPWNKATQPYPHSVRGGSWDDDAPALRSAARRGSDRQWKMTDPQLPKGKWYFTDAPFVGFRVVRPLQVPSPEEMTKYWISGVEKE